MPAKFAAVVQNASDLDHAIGARPAQEKMAGILDALAAYAGPAQRNVVCPRSLNHQVQTIFGTRPIGIFRDIHQRLPEEFPVSE
jgi:hypothetical protein